jgi:hypothetical protein
LAWTAGHGSPERIVENLARAGYNGQQEAPLMPLRDHFHSPLNDKRSWDELHGQWPAMIVQSLYHLLPDGYVAAPTVHLGAAFEIDVSTYEEDEPSPPGGPTNAGEGVAPGTWKAPSPTLTLEVDLPEQDEYEVRVYDVQRGRRLVAAIELVSPSNKDRPESRRAFVTKTAALLQQDVCVSVVDIVTVRHFNLYADLLQLVGGSDPALGTEPLPLYSATLRRRQRVRRRTLLDTWFYPLVPGKPLPTLPIWLDSAVGVSLDLEATYEDTCRVLRIA